MLYTYLFVQLCIIFVEILFLNKYLLDIDNCNQKDCLWRPYLLLLAYNVVPVLIGSTLVTYVEVYLNLYVFIIDKV